MLKADSARHRYLKVLYPHSPEIAHLTEVPNVRQRGTDSATGDQEQATELLQVPDRETLEGECEYTVLALLIGCALRRRELGSIRIEDLQVPCHSLPRRLEWICKRDPDLLRGRSQHRNGARRIQGRRACGRRWGCSASLPPVCANSAHLPVCPSLGTGLLVQSRRETGT